MKKFLLPILCLVLLCSTAYAGLKRNVYQTWSSVSEATMTTVTPSFPSRAVLIQNGSAVDVCVDLSGGTVTNSCTSPGAFQLNGATDIYLEDYVTTAITMISMSGTASPVSVVVTY